MDIQIVAAELHIRTDSNVSYIVFDIYKWGKRHLALTFHYDLREEMFVAIS